MTPDEQIAHFASNYDIVAKYSLMNKNEKIYIGKKDQKICRYCGKGDQEVPFKTVAHAVPEFIGNKSLISYDECDVCNELFSRVVEDHLAKYLGASRTISQLYGKKGVPTYVAKDGKSKISLQKTGIQITTYENDPIAELDLENNTMTIKAYRHPYSPMGAYKCLIKMALAIMPEDDLEDCQHLIDWIREETHSFESFRFKPLNVLMQFTPGPSPYKGVHLFLLKRREAKGKMPHMYFVVAFGNTLFQTFMPMPWKDKHLMDEPMNLTFFPVPFDNNHSFGNTKRGVVDFSSPITVKDEYQQLVMGFERAEKAKLS